MRREIAGKKIGGLVARLPEVAGIYGSRYVNGPYPGLDDAVGTRRETRWKLAEGIGGLSGVRRELVEGDRELARKTSRVHRKKTKRLVGRFLGVAEKLAGTAHEERGSEQDECEVGYCPRVEEAPSGAPTGKKSHKERLTMTKTRLDVLEASLEELY
ncbi:hypothetical protein BHE74_00020473 [Ensete ventricosum]|nr:hypothetical protein BHE74_00020473 [Ensete ventricosum]